MSEESEKIGIDDIAGRVADMSGEKPDTVKNFIHTLFDTIKQELHDEERVPIYQFGTFKKSHTEERPGKLPGSGEEITIPAGYRIHFSPSGQLADAVNWKYSHLSAYDLPDDVSDDVSEDMSDDVPDDEPDNISCDVPDDAADDVPGKVPDDLALPGIEPVTPSDEDHPRPVEHEEMVSLLGPERKRRTAKKKLQRKKGKREPEIRRAVIAVLTAAVIMLLLGAFILGRYVVGRGTEETLLTMDSVETEEPISVNSETGNNPEAGYNSTHGDIPATEKSPVSGSEKTGTEDAGGDEENVLRSRTAESHHIVRYGDTFVALAEKYWGDKYLWPVMYLDNRERFPDPDIVKTGQTIEIRTSPVLIAPDGSEEPDESEQQIVLEAYIETYRIYRQLGETFIELGAHNRNVYLQNYGLRRLVEARTVIYHATRFDPDFIEKVRDELVDNDYSILKRFFDYNGPVHGS